MANIQQIVKAELESNPFIVDMLLEELANITALAQKIKKTPALKALGKDIKVSAISMAIRRYVESNKKKKIHNWDFPKNLEISSKSKVYEVAFERSNKLDVIIEEINSKITKSKGNFLSIVEGTYEILIFTNQKNKSIIKKIISKEMITSEIDNLFYVSVNWEKATKDIPGIYYRITRELAFKNISIQSFHTIGAEMMLFFKEDCFLSAYETISGLISVES